jgi:hypothetical protein
MLKKLKKEAADIMDSKFKVRNMEKVLYTLLMEDTTWVNSNKT